MKAQQAFLARIDEFGTSSFLAFFFLCKYRFHNFSEQDIQQFHQKKLLYLADFAFRHSAFFREHYAFANLAEYKQLPTVNKKIMMDNLTAYNTVGLTKEEIMHFCLETEKTRDFTKRLKGFNVGMSSGTSGNKGVEIASVREENYMRAAVLARFPLPQGVKVNLAFILRVSSPAFKLDKFGHKLTYISQLGSIENIRLRLEKLNPNIISAPPQMLELLAQDVVKGALNINPLSVVSYGEVLYPDVKQYLEDVFGCLVHQIYKCTEGPIGITCKSGSLHINEDMVAVEIYHADGTPTPKGQPCKQMIISDLHKRSQPIIRYELNDVITISPEKCACGSNFRVIEEIQGRANDMFWGIRTADKTKHFIFQDFISRAIISTSDEIEAYQAIQKDYDRVVVNVQISKPEHHEWISEQLQVRIREVFAAYGCIEPVVEVSSSKPAPNKHSGKLARIICEVKHKYSKEN